MAMKNKDEIINISKAAINSPELDNINRTNAVISCRDIKKIKKRKIPDVNKKVSYKQDENLTKTAKKDEAAINKFKKEINENYKTPKEVLVKLNRETEVRSKTEADVGRVNKQNHITAKVFALSDPSGLACLFVCLFYNSKSYI